MSNFSETKLSSEEQVIWSSIVSRTVATFQLNEEEKAFVMNDVLIRMFGLLPYYAECPNPVGVGLLNVSIYLTERKGGRDLFLHTEDNDHDYVSRLKPFYDIMRGGNEEVIEKGLAMAGLVLLNDYLHDREADANNGKYNPLNSGSWNYDSARQTLTGHAVRLLPGHRLETILSLKVIAERFHWLPGGSD